MDINENSGYLFLLPMAESTITLVDPVVFKRRKT